jgi:hypothetical protein
MKAFIFHQGNHKHTIAAIDIDQAKAYYKENIKPYFDLITPVPTEDMGKPMVRMFEDNDIEKETFMASLNELITGNEPQLVCTTDDTLIC